jgi:hypothetical protein
MQVCLTHFSKQGTPDVSKINSEIVALIFTHDIFPLERILTICMHCCQIHKFLVYQFQHKDIYVICLPFAFSESAFWTFLPFIIVKTIIYILTTTSKQQPLACRGPLFCVLSMKVHLSNY